MKLHISEWDVSIIIYNNIATRATYSIYIYIYFKALYSYGRCLIKNINLTIGVYLQLFSFKNNLYTNV